MNESNMIDRKKCNDLSKTVSWKTRLKFRKAAILSLCKTWVLFFVFDKQKLNFSYKNDTRPIIEVTKERKLKLSESRTIKNELNLLQQIIERRTLSVSSGGTYTSRKRRSNEEHLSDSSSEDSE